MLEGRVPGIIGIPDFLQVLEISGLPDIDHHEGKGGFRGPLPLALARCENIQFLLASHHNLEGSKRDGQEGLLLSTECHPKYMGLKFFASTLLINWLQGSDKGNLSGIACS